MRSVDMHICPDYTWQVSKLEVLTSKMAVKTHIHESAKRTLCSSVLDVSVRQNNGAVLPPKFHKHRLEMLASRRGNNPTDASAPCEVDLLHTRMRHELFGNRRPLRSLMSDQIETASRKSGFAEDICNRPSTPRSRLGALENRRVSRGEWESDGSETEVVRGVPGISL
jgi:hypothetical protein